MMDHNGSFCARSVVLRKLQLALPMKLHELLLALDYKHEASK